VKAVCLAALLLAASAPAFAAEHGNLDEGRPLHFEDPYPVPRGEWSFEAGGGTLRGLLAHDHLYFPVEALYGVALNAQISVGTEFVTHPRASGSDSLHYGDLTLSALYNFTQETSSLPAIGLKYTVDLPTGVNSLGVDARLKALVTKSIGAISFHLNASEFFAGERSFGDRYSHAEVDLGASFPPGYPQHTRTLLLLGVFTQQSPVRGVEGLKGIEVGIRRQQSARTVLDLGIARESVLDEFAHLRINAGLSWSY
jgi:hypothetical protein